MSGGMEACNPIRTPAHYVQHKIQPMEFIGLNNLGFLEGNIIKYVCRYKLKNGIEDLKKAQFYLEKLIQREMTGVINFEVKDDEGRDKQTGHFMEQVCQRKSRV